MFCKLLHSLRVAMTLYANYRLLYLKLIKTNQMHSARRWPLRTIRSTGMRSTHQNIASKAVSRASSRHPIELAFLHTVLLETLPPGYLEKKQKLFKQPDGLRMQCVRF